MLTKFKEFKNLVEKQIGCHIKCLRIDRGEEDILETFQAFCKNREILHQLTMPQMPQQNVVFERKNRTILNMVRCMFNEKNVPKEFWGDSISWVCYLFNSFPSR